MASGLYFIVFLCLTIGLWTGANAEYVDSVAHCCKACPPGWTQFEQNCYMFNFGPEDWTSSEVACISMGGNLASFHTRKEYDFFKTTIKRLTGKDTRTWVGGYDAVKEGVWLWSDGSKFDFQIWGVGEPSNGYGLEHCMELNYSGHPNDHACNTKEAFLCKKHL